MINAFTRRHTPQKARKNLTYDEQLGATGKVKDQAPLFAPDEDEAGDVPIESDMDEDMVEVVGETLQNPFDDESMARNLQEQEFTGPPSSDVPDISVQVALEDSRLEAARRRDEEDLALIRALRASKSDARLQFDAGEKEPSIAATKSTASMLGDSDEDDFEEVEVPDLRTLPAEEPEAAPCTTDSQYFDLPVPTAAPEGNALAPLDSEDRALIEAAILKDQWQQEQTGEQQVTSEMETPKKLITTTGIRNVSTRAEPTSRIVASGLASGSEIRPETPQPSHTPQPKLPILQTARLSSPITDEIQQHHDVTSDIPRHRDFGMPKVLDTTPKTRKEPRIEPSSEMEPPSKMAVDVEENEAVKECSIGGGADKDVAANLHDIEASTDRDVPEDLVMRQNGLLDDPDLRSTSMPVENQSVPPPVTQPSRIQTESPLRQIDEAGKPGSSESDDDDLDDSRSLEWSLSPEPERRSTQTRTFPTPPPDLEEEEGGIDMNAEGDDYARFLASIQHRNLEQVRQELDNEIRDLNQQNKVAMRDSEEITHQMVAQIQVSAYIQSLPLSVNNNNLIQLLLRLFGIPYVTAPMEAEAQCAELARLNLVDGVITDDNDVFLFGASQCFKNLFNDAKYVECFLAADLAREMSLTRDRLITIAYLLGSDYTEGLPGIGPVAGMEIMANFPGPRGLQNFKAWWTAVQQGKDDVANESKWQKSFVSLPACLSQPHV